MFLPIFPSCTSVLHTQYTSVFHLCLARMAIYHQPSCTQSAISHNFKMPKKSLSHFSFPNGNIYWLISLQSKGLNFILKKGFSPDYVVSLYKDNWDKGAGHLSLSDILVLSIGGSSGRGLQKMLSSEKRPNTTFQN